MYDTKIRPDPTIILCVRNFPLCSSDALIRLPLSRAVADWRQRPRGRRPLPGFSFGDRAARAKIKWAPAAPSPRRRPTRKLPPLPPKQQTYISLAALLHLAQVVTLHCDSFNRYSCRQATTERSSCLAAIGRARDGTRDCGRNY